MNQFEHSSKGYATQTKNTQLLLASLVLCLKSSLKLVWTSCTVAHLVQYSEALQKQTDQLIHQYSLSLCTNILQICRVPLVSRRLCFILIIFMKNALLHQSLRSSTVSGLNKLLRLAQEIFTKLKRIFTVTVCNSVNTLSSDLQLLDTLHFCPKNQVTIFSFLPNGLRKSCSELFLYH